jgi:hypothetical protein
VFNGASYPGYGKNDIVVAGWNFYTLAPIWARRVGSTLGDSPASIRWDGNRLIVVGYVGGSFNPGSGTVTTAGGQDAVILRYEKATGIITSSGLVGGTGNDRASALWCNTTNREEVVGGVFSNNSLFPGGTITPRASVGAFDGFLFRLVPQAGVREGVEEVSLAAGALKAYPQPVRARGNLTVMADEPSPNATLLDMQGRLIRNLSLAKGENTIAVPATQGIYLLHTDKGSLKIVVE